MGGIIYKGLEEIISFEGFDYEKYYDGEVDILTPRLAALGYTHIRFSMGEFDSFGPLTRVCRCIDSDGKERWFIYG